MRIGRYNISLTRVPAPEPPLPAGSFQVMEAQSWAAHQREMEYRRNTDWTYITPGLTAGNGRIDSPTRIRWVEAARNRSLRDPLFQRVVNVVTDFALGRGCSLPSVNDKEAGGQADALTTLVERFWRNEWNFAALTGPKPQLRRFCGLQIDGEMASVMERKGTEWLVSILDPLEVVEIVPHQAVPETPMLYLREYCPVGEIVPKKQWFWSRWAEIDGEEKKRLTDVYGPLNWQSGEPPQDNRWLFLDTVGPDAQLMRGCPPYWCIIPWSDSVNDLASMLKTYVRAMVAWVWNVKLQGTAADISAKQTAMGSKVDQSVPPPPPNSIRLNTNGETLEPINISAAGGQLFQHGFELCRLMVCAGTGVPVHYLMGDPSTGNLATASAMEFPVRKLMERWQLYWSSAFSEKVAFMARMAGLSVNVESSIDFSLPELDSKDLPALLTALSSAKTAGVLADEDIARIAAYAVNAGDFEEMVERALSAPVPEADKTLSAMIESGDPRALGVVQRVYEAMRRKVVKNA